MYQFLDLCYQLEDEGICIVHALMNWMNEPKLLSYWNRLVKIAVDHLDGLISNGAPAYDAWNSSAVLLIKAAQAHARYFVTECYVRSIAESNVSEPVRLVLNQLCELFLIYWLLERSGDFVLVTRLSSSEPVMVYTDTKLPTVSFILKLLHHHLWTRNRQIRWLVQ